MSKQRFEAELVEWTELLEQEQVQLSQQEWVVSPEDEQQDDSLTAM